MRKQSSGESQSNDDSADTEASDQMPPEQQGTHTAHECFSERFAGSAHGNALDGDGETEA